MKSAWKLILNLFLFFVWLTTDSYSAPTRGIVPIPIKGNAGNQVLLYKESHALVIGVSEYTGDGWPRLPGVMDDVREVKKALESQGFNVVVVRNSTRETMEKAFSDFINKYGHGEDNRLLFYFAGHGYTDKPKYGGEMGYIVPADAPDPNRDKTGFLNKAMDMEMFNVYAKRIRAKHAMFLFDSCFSGSLFALSRAIPEVIQEKTSRPVRQFITAGTAEQTVPDRSIFRDQLVRALSGDADMNKDGYVTGTELGQFLEDSVTNYSRRSQTPKYGKISDPNLDKGDFVFAMKPAKSLPDMNVEMKSIEIERSKLTNELKAFNEEKQKLDAMRRKLVEEREKLANLEPPKSIKKIHTPSLGEMVKIPSGDYLVGVDKDLAFAECHRYYENCKNTWPAILPSQRISVGSFSIDKYEVTQAEFEHVIGSNPSYFKALDLPVDSVTWYEAFEYCRKKGKRLPTEWEWEKAAKGGKNLIYAWGDSGNLVDEYAWNNNNSDNKTHPVGQKRPNGYGLYDTVGNVWEWTASSYDNNGKVFVLHGGSWFNNPYNTRPAYRILMAPGFRANYIGFRCAK